MKVEIKIKEYRLEKNWTLKQLSLKSGVSTTHISDIEKGSKEPSLFVMVRIARALHEEITNLYEIK